MGLPCTILFTSGSLRLRIICSATERAAHPDSYSVPGNTGEGGTTLW
jgi:hypothetical protein